MGRMLPGIPPPSPPLYSHPLSLPSIPSHHLPSLRLHGLSIQLPLWEGIPEALLVPSPTMPSQPSPRASHSVLFHEVDEGRALHLHGLPLPVIHGQHEVEEVGFPEVGGRLLLKVCSCQAHATVGRGAGNPRKCSQREGPHRLWPGGGAGQDLALPWARGKLDGPIPRVPGSLQPRQEPLNPACSLGNRQWQQRCPSQAPSEASPWAPHSERLISKTKCMNSPCY